jgi:hypothetical protein
MTRFGRRNGGAGIEVVVSERRHDLRTPPIIRHRRLLCESFTPKGDPLCPFSL